ncbi:hypothetical protein [Novosphingobium sp. 9]|uniref:hypothetical protein n=1 Tax=Novosphingobium sp. 9 TaxID=2025349 RepID=UPI0021B5D98A|nr:hypothetical protein [Novosphingobium sp. 9]
MSDTRSTIAALALACLGSSLPATPAHAEHAPSTTPTATTLRLAPARLASETWIVPPVVMPGTRLPTPPGYSVSWMLDGQRLRTSVLQNASSKAKAVQLTGTMTLPTGEAITKRFKVLLLGNDAHRLIAYARIPTGAQQANQPLIARSVHLALGIPGKKPQPLNGNYGVLFASGDYVGIDRVDQRGIANPALFYFADGSLGIIATRVTMAGTPVPSQSSSALIYKADPHHHANFTELGLLHLDAAGEVRYPQAVWDSSAGHYVVSWKDQSGAPHWATVEDLARTEMVPTPYFPFAHGMRSQIAVRGNLSATHEGPLASVDTRSGDTGLGALPMPGWPAAWRSAVASPRR